LVFQVKPNFWCFSKVSAGTTDEFFQRDGESKFLHLAWAEATDDFSKTPSDLQNRVTEMLELTFYYIRVGCVQFSLDFATAESDGHQLLEGPIMHFTR
jgi:hypothetical protein